MKATGIDGMDVLALILEADLEAMMAPGALEGRQGVLQIEAGAALVRLEEVGE